MAYLVGYCPELFFGIALKQQIMWVITVAYTTITFPLLTVFLLWRLGFIESMYMRNIKERYAPLIASMMFYFWIFWLFHKQFKAPEMLQILMANVFITAVLTFLVSIFYKVSMHTSACAAMFGFAIYMALSGIQGSIALSLILTLVLGLVASSRLALKEHTNKQVYVGAILGILALPISIFIVKLIS